jgi:bifunctional DNA-binding transcriptional regulator/antitoxin component of YhaV-PrlF toxin-antitoxin module
MVNEEEGKLIQSVMVADEGKQKRIAIPQHIVELLGIGKGDKFNWYVKKQGNKVSLRAVYIRYLPAQKYFKSEELSK